MLGSSEASWSCAVEACVGAGALGAGGGDADAVATVVAGEVVAVAAVEAGGIGPEVAVLLEGEPTMGGVGPAVSLGGVGPGVPGPPLITRRRGALVSRGWENERSARTALRRVGGGAGATAVAKKGPNRILKSKYIKLWKNAVINSIEIII